MKKILLTVLVLAGISATAQVKVGSNPTTIDTGTTNFQVEGTTTAQQFVVLKNGNVGIGTTTPIAPLQVYGGIYAGDETNLISGGFRGYHHNANSATTSFSIYKSRAGADVLVGDQLAQFLGAGLTNGVYRNSGRILIGVGNTAGANYLPGYIDFGVVPTAGVNIASAMRITSDLNVGIGTTTPTEKLEVTGSIKMVDGNQAAGAFMVSDAAGKATWTAPATALGASASKWTNDATNTRVALTNLSDGTTARTNTSLEFTDLGSFLINRGSNVPTANAVFSSYANNESIFMHVPQQISLTRYASGIATVPSLVFGKANGTVSAPAAMTTVNSNLGRISFNALVDDGVGGLTSSQAAYIQSTQEGTLGTNTATARIAFFTRTDGTLGNGSGNLAERMRITSTGNVGIGTATPTEKLDVAGSIKMVDGNQAAGAFMVSDAAGKATWTPAATALGAASSKWTNDATNTRVALTNLSDGTTARTTGTEFVVKDNGYVGIGTNQPEVLLNMSSSKTTNDETEMMLDTYSESAGESTLYFRKARNNGTATQAGDRLGDIRFLGHDGTGFISKAAARIISTTKSVSAGKIEGDLWFQTQNAAGLLETRQYISSSGNVGIGTTTPRGTQIDENDVAKSFTRLEVAGRGGKDADIIVSVEGDKFPQMSYRRFNGVTKTNRSWTTGITSAGDFMISDRIDDTTPDNLFAVYIKKGAAQLGVNVTSQTAMMDATNYISSAPYNLTLNGSIDMLRLRYQSNNHFVVKSNGALGVNVSNSLSLADFYSFLTINGYAKLGSTDALADAATADKREGMIRYTTANGLQYHTATNWVDIAKASDLASFDSTKDAWTNDSANGRVKLQTYSDGITSRVAGTQFNITDSGNVAIGLENPTSKFDVNGTGNFRGTSLDVGGAATSLYTTKISIWDNTSNPDINNLTEGSAAGSLIQSYLSGHMVMGLRENDVLDAFSIVSGGGNWSSDQIYDKNIATFRADGNVGIGTTNPKSKLHVTGLPIYADNAAALAGLGGVGVAEGAFYHTGDGIVRVVY